MWGHPFKRPALPLVLLLELLLGILIPLLPAIPLPDEPVAERVMALLRSQETWEDEDAYLTLLVVDRDQEQAKWVARRLRKNYRKTEDANRKTLLIFLHPRQNYKQIYLDFSYGDASKPHDGWVYSHDTRRIARMIYQENESLLTRHRLFYGTDFTFGDFLDRHPDRDHHKILKRENLNHKECLVIESSPREDISINQGYPYEKRISWIWKDHWLLLKTEHYDRKGGLVKTLHNHWVKVQGFWTLTQSLMKDHSKDHSTIIATYNVRYNTKIADSFFLPSNLPDTAEFYTQKAGANDAVR